MILADKAINNIIIVCKKCCIQRLIEELCVFNSMANYLALLLNNI